MKFTLPILLLMMLLASGLAAPTKKRVSGNSEVFAAVPGVGGDFRSLPEGIALDHEGKRVFVSGPAAFGKTGPAYVHEYDLSGTLVHTYLITFQNPFIPFRAASCLVTRKEQGIEYVYVIEPFVGIVRITVDGQDAGAQVLYATLPQPAPGQQSLANDLAFDSDGNLFVTDSFTNMIYRIPNEGDLPRAATTWFTIPIAASTIIPFGANGIRVSDDAVIFVFSVESSGRSGIYSLPLQDASPSPADMALLHAFDPLPCPPSPFPCFQIADGIALAKTGEIIVALAGINKIAVLNADGSMLVEYTQPPGVTKAWTNPANIAFDNRNNRLLITNHASLDESAAEAGGLWVVFDLVTPFRG